MSELDELRSRRAALAAQLQRECDLAAGRVAAPLHEAWVRPDTRARDINELEEHLMVLDRLINQLQKGTNEHRS